LGGGFERREGLGRTGADKEGRLRLVRRILESDRNQKGHVVGKREARINEDSRWGTMRVTQ